MTARLRARGGCVFAPEALAQPFGQDRARSHEAGHGLLLEVEAGGSVWSFEEGLVGVRAWGWNGIPPTRGLAGGGWLHGAHCTTRPISSTRIANRAGTHVSSGRQSPAGLKRPRCFADVPRARRITRIKSAKQGGTSFFRPIREAVLTVEKMKADPAPRDTCVCSWLATSKRRLSASLGVIGFVGIPTSYSDRGAETGHPTPKLFPSTPMTTTRKART